LKFAKIKFEFRWLEAKQWTNLMELIMFCEIMKELESQPHGIQMTLNQRQARLLHQKRFWEIAHESTASAVLSLFAISKRFKRFIESFPIWDSRIAIKAKLSAKDVYLIQWIWYPVALASSERHKAKWKHGGLGCHAKGSKIWWNSGRCFLWILISTYIK
jgi:hypothetical protein